MQGPQTECFVYTIYTLKRITLHLVFKYSILHVCLNILCITYPNNKFTFFSLASSSWFFPPSPRVQLAQATLTLMCPLPA